MRLFVFINSNELFHVKQLDQHFLFLIDEKT